MFKEQKIKLNILDFNENILILLSNNQLYVSKKTFDILDKQNLLGSFIDFEISHLKQRTYLTSLGKKEYLACFSLFLKKFNKY